MKTKTCTATIAGIALFCWCTRVDAIEIKGTVRSATAENAIIVTEGEFLPSVGDTFEVFFKLAGADDEISVATGSVVKVEADSVELKIENATGDVAKDQLVRITSDKPQKRTSAASGATASKPPAQVSPGATTAASPAAFPSTTRADGRDPSFAFVDMNKLFKDYSKTKEGEAKFNANKDAAKKEYDERFGAYKNLLDEINALNRKLESSPKAELASERDAKITRIKTMETEINSFRTTREKELQDQVVQLREGIVPELTRMVKSVAGNTSLVIDSSGNSVHGVPVAVFSPPDGNMTERVSSALEAGEARAPFIALRDVPIGLVDMNQIFKSLEKTKRAETNINKAKDAAKKEYDDRTANYKKAVDEINTLNQQIEGRGLSRGVKTQKAKKRDEKVANIKNMEHEMNEFRQRREGELQEQVFRMREGIVKEITDAITTSTASGRPALILDKSGNSLNGVPLVLFNAGIPDFSDGIVAALNKATSAGAAPSLVSSTRLKVANIDATRAFKAMPETKQAEEEIAAMRKSAEAELANADAAAKQAKEKELQDATAKKREAIVAKLTAKVRHLAEAGGYNLVLDSSGQSLNGVPILLSTHEVPDLTDKIVDATQTVKDSEIAAKVTEEKTIQVPSPPPPRAMPTPNEPLRTAKQTPARENPAAEWTDLTNAPQKLVGTWQGTRHRKQYFADGTFVTDPHLVPNPPRTQWRVEGDRLTEYYSGAGSNITLRILSIDNRELVTTDDQGHTFRAKRISDAQAAREKANW